jgi:hypothetical protein
MDDGSTLLTIWCHRDHDGRVSMYCRYTGVISVILAETIVMLNAQLLITSFIFGEALMKHPELLV